MPTTVTLIFLLLSIAIIVTITLVQMNRKQILSPGLKYGIVLDAGSSRTTVYVYEWPAEKENNTGVVSQTFKCNVKGPGISSYGSNPQEIAMPINDCMNKVKEKIPFHLHKSTPVYLGATAGMRLLRLQNESAASEVLQSIQTYFISQPFEFRDAQIITGQEEGVYGWITANYLKGNFLEKNLWSAWVHPRGVETIGALDLGGASTQISFIPEESMQTFNSTLQVQLFGYQYSVYTYSFQCYGRDEAEKKLLASILQAFSGFYYTVNALNLTGQFSLTEFNSSMWTFCSQDWNQLPFMLSKFEETYARSYCFSANYIYQLLVRGYKFNADNWPQIHFQKEVDNSSIAWSLGYMLSLTNMIPAESNRIWLPMNPSLFAGLLLFFTAVALLCLIFLVYSYVRSRMQKNTCQVEHVFAIE
ncbi:PREDICTED: ectonucleoside triphosphate diphosphohydrolase 3 isoform X3 [Thamnophis sirtalis]|uniref:Ectonucleoside triphosphate diphosphohydrolase 3 isoform X3 n=1 Tax=Thamnophis sirtalis TaxID=35019 RepID=A0A6I9XU15_9SAUR|nr:PREDICTED: ectonucleoside triphosphate diphosphohydrolase 3 isoform X3 [Thamnophis sirtalis]